MPGAECGVEEAGSQVEDIEDIFGGDQIEPKERYCSHVVSISHHLSSEGIKIKNFWCQECEKRRKLW